MNQALCQLVFTTTNLKQTDSAEFQYQKGMAITKLSRPARYVYQLFSRATTRLIFWGIR